MHLFWIIFICIFSIFMSACSKKDSDYEKAKQVINQGLVSKATCKSIPVDVPVSKDELDKSAALEQLFKQGYVQEAQIQNNKNKEKYLSGYTFTDKGKSLIVTPAKIDGWQLKYPCIKQGHYKIKSIEAIDAGMTITGLNIANVRATIEFVPEDWMLATKNLTEWSEYWKATKNAESKQWMYQLGKSGDEFYFGGMGSPL